MDHFRAAYERGQHATKEGQSTEAKREFEKARALYVGDYHTGCYEEWVLSRRLALIDTRLSLLSELGLLYVQGKEWELAVSCYRDMLVVDCYREDVYRQLMRCYCSCGRLADVKRTYQSYLKILHSDLHLAPAPETTLLYEQLIQRTTILEAN